MNFFAHQAAARAKTRRMLWLFALAVLIIVAAINGVVVLVFGATQGAQGHATQTQTLAPMLIASTAVTLAVIGLGSVFKTLSLRGGGGAVARAMGGTLVPEDPRDFQQKRLRNVVEEMAIAAGMPVPEIYVLDRESGINAFAAGYASSDAAVAVTRGALDRLSRDELQGVIAHEFSHILNGDMRLNLRLMGLIFGLLVLGLSGRKVLEHLRVGSKRDGNAILLIALAVMIFGYLGVFLGRLIKAYISRQREYLADASAVQFTRLSHGLSGALMKIGAFQAGSKLTDHDGEEVAHMLFGDGVGYSSLTATHPPLIERIQRIDPLFDPQMLAQLATTEARFDGIDEEVEPLAASALLAGFSSTSLAAAPARPRLSDRVQSAQPQQVVANVANPSVSHVDYAVAMRQSLPAILTAAAHMRERALDVVLALLVARESDPAEQLAEIGKRLGTARAKGSAELIDIARELHPAQRMPLAQLALPALKRRPAGELHLLIETIDMLIQSDGHVEVFEYALARLLRQQLAESMEPGSASSGKAKLPQVRAEALAVLATLAQHGHNDRDGARRAFLAGGAVLFPGDPAAYAPPANWIDALDRALPALDALLPTGKETLVLALATTVGHDGQIAVVEAELLRLICALLHCPLPPILGA